jgi:hypothetical protein
MKAATSCWRSIPAESLPALALGRPAPRTNRWPTPPLPCAAGRSWGCRVWGLQPWGRMESTRAVRGSGQAPPQGGTVTSASVPADWQIYEAPMACTLTFVCKGVHVHLTMRDISDDALFARIKRIYPKSKRRHSSLLEAGNSQAEPSLKIPRIPLQGSGKNHEPKSQYRHSCHAT